MAAILVAACKPEIDFTRLPPVGPPSPQPLAVTTLITVDIPLAVEAERVALAEALPAGPRKLYGWLDNAVCTQPGGAQPRREPLRRGQRCVGANVTGEVVRSGTPRIDTIEGRAAIVVPYDYRLAVRGISWAGDRREVRNGQLVVAYPLAVTVGAELELRVQPLANPAIVPRSVSVLAGEMDLTEPVTRALGLAARATTRRTAIRAGLAPTGTEPSVLHVRAAMERVWQALHEPVSLGDPRKPRFLRIEPAGLSTIGVVGGEVPGSFAYRFGIEARTTMIEEGEPQPAPLLARPLPTPTLASHADSMGDRGGSRLRKRIVVPLEPLRASVQALATAEPALPTTPAEASDIPTALISAEITRAEMFAAREQLAIGLTLKLPGPLPPLDLLGRAFLVGSPRLAEDGRRIQIDRLALTEPSIARSAGLPSGTIEVALPMRPETERVRRIDLAPLADRLARSAHLPLDGAIEKAITALAADFDGGPRGNRNAIVTGRLGAARAVAVVPGRDHLTILIDVDAVLQVRAADILARSRPSATLEPTQWQAPMPPAVRTPASRR